jgi:hypothetical protein
VVLRGPLKDAGLIVLVEFVQQTEIVVEGKVVAKAVKNALYHVLLYRVLRTAVVDQENSVVFLRENVLRTALGDSVRRIETARLASLAVTRLVV